MKRIDVAIAVIVRDRQILICQRKDGDSFGGFWEFPGGKCEADETLENCVIREVREELDLHVKPLSKFQPIPFNYPRVSLTLHPFLCELISGEPKLIECQNARWISAAQLRDYRFPPADEPLLEELIRRFTPSADSP